MKNPLVSVVIVTLNNRFWLRRCIKNLKSQSYKNTEIFVADNGSEDGTCEMMKKEFPGIELIEVGENVGFGKAANLAIRKARGKYFLIYNDDAFCEKDAIGLLVARMESDSKLGACQGTLLFADRSGRVESMGSYLTPTGILLKESGFKFEKEKAGECEIFNANLPLIRKSVFDEIGLFDEDYFLYFEEADLCWRMWLANYKVLYYPPAIIYHARGVTTGKLKPPLVVESAFGNRINSLLKNLEVSNLVKILPLHLIICFGGMVAYLAKGKSQGSLAIFRAIVKNIKTWPKTKKKREKIQKLRKVSDRQLFKKIMRPMGVRYFVNLALNYLKAW